MHLTMKKTALTLVILFPFLLNAQHENHYEEIEPVRTEAYELSFSDQHSQKGFLFVKMEIDNLSDDYLLFKPHEGTFTVRGKAFDPEKEKIIIPPGKSETHKFKLRGDANFHVDSAKAEIAGLYRFSGEGEVQKAEPFKLPAAKNSFEVGKGTFECKLDGDVKKETDVTKAAFECTYRGDGVGLLNHKKVTVKTEEGDEYRNKKKKGMLGKIAGKKKDEKTLLKGESAKVKTEFQIPSKVADMQFATLFIHWNDCFQESMPEGTDSHSVRFILDEAKTEGMND